MGNSVLCKCPNNCLIVIFQFIYRRQNKIEIKDEITCCSLQNKSLEKSMSFHQMFAEKIEIENLPQTNDETYELTHNDNISIALSSLQEQEIFDEQQFLEQVHQFPIDTMGIQSQDSYLNIDLINLSNLGQKCVSAFMHLYQLQEPTETLKSGDLEIQYNPVELPDKNWLTTIRFSYTIKTTISEYLKYINDLETQLKVETSIEEYQRLAGDENCCVLYLRYKKIMLIDQREFLYLKYTDHGVNQVVEVTKSIDIPGYSPKVKSKSQPCRAIIRLSGNIIEQIDNKYIKIQSFSQTDNRSRIAPKIMKNLILSEIKKQIERIKQNLEKNKNNS